MTTAIDTIELEADWRLLQRPAFPFAGPMIAAKEPVLTVMGSHFCRAQVLEKLKGGTMTAYWDGIDLGNFFRQLIVRRFLADLPDFYYALSEKLFERRDRPLFGTNSDLEAVLFVANRLGDYHEAVARVLDDWMEARPWHPDDVEAMGLKPEDNNWVGTEATNDYELEARAFKLFMLGIKLGLLERTYLEVHIDDVLKNELVGDHRRRLAGLVFHIRALKSLRHCFHGVTFLLGWSGTYEEAAQLPPSLVETLDATRVRG